MGSGVIRLLNAGGYTWTIDNNGSGWTYVVLLIHIPNQSDLNLCSIQDGGKTVYWGLAQAIIGEKVNFSAGTGSDRQSWVLVPIPS